MLMKLFLSLLILSFSTCFILVKLLKKAKKENNNLKHTIERDKLVEKRKENFIANLTHDLKTPTFAQINSLNMLLNGSFGYLNNQQKEILGLAQGSCKYVSDLISTILDTYKCNQGNLYLNKVPFDFVNIIMELKKEVLPLAKGNNQNLIFEITDNEIIIFADKLQIKRVVTNMINNAITYGDKNSDIIINLITKDNQLRFSVTNKTDPIEEIETNSMFKIFQQTEKSKLNDSSTGLGLYLSKQIIDMHNGEIFAKNGENRTCIFGFNLPTNYSDKLDTNSNSDKMQSSVE